MDDNIHRHADFLDYGLPQLLTEGLYYPDGQILDEVYVYGSFMQSKMYARDVRCSDCHDVHSIRRIKDGNDLCLQCHRAAIYDQKGHHFHKTNGVRPASRFDPHRERCFSRSAAVPGAKPATCPAAITWALIIVQTTASACRVRI